MPRLPVRLPALLTRGKGREKNSCWKNPRNPLKSLDSNERIQGNPRKSNTSQPGFLKRNGEAKENPNPSSGPTSRARRSERPNRPSNGKAPQKGKTRAGQPSLWCPPDSGTNGMIFPPKMSERATEGAPSAPTFLTTFKICCAPGGPTGMTMVPVGFNCCKSGGGMWSMPQVLR